MAGTSHLDLNSLSNVPVGLPPLLAPWAQARLPTVTAPESPPSIFLHTLFGPLFLDELLLTLSKVLDAPMVRREGGGREGGRGGRRREKEGGRGQGTEKRRLHPAFRELPQG